MKIQRQEGMVREGLRRIQQQLVPPETKYSQAGRTPLAFVEKYLSGPGPPSVPRGGGGRRVNQSTLKRLQQ